MTRRATIASICLRLLLGLEADSSAHAFSRIDLTEGLSARVQSFSTYGTNRFRVVTQFVPASFERELVVPPMAVLRTAVAIPTQVWTTDLREKVRPTLVQITWRAGPRTLVLLEKLLDARRPSHQKWFEVAVDLASQRGQRGVLRFSAKPAGTASGFVALWDSPEIVSLTPPVPPGLILVVVDALRADRLQPYGYPRPTSRYLERLSRDSILFLKAFASAPKTIPSVPQLLTSSYFPDQVPAPTLTELLRGSGLSPARAIVNNPYVASWLQQNSSGLGVLREGEMSARAIGRLASEWIEQSRGVPFLLLLHFLDTHTPYRPPEVFSRPFLDPGYQGPVGLLFNDVSGAWQGRYGKSDQKRIGDLYDGAIRYVDHHLGRLIEGLKRLGRYDSTVIAVTADHGEELWDHGRFFHGQSLYDELMHVPLIIKLPNQKGAGERIGSVARLVDVAPTLVDVVAEAAGAGNPGGGGDGRSLLPLTQGQEERGRVVFATVSRGEPNAPLRQAIRTQRYKYILTMNTGEEELYDLESDPGEQRNLARLAPGLAASLRSTMTRTGKALSGVGYRIEISNRGAQPVSYQVRLATQPAVPLVEINRVNLEKGDVISVGRHSDGFALAGRLLPGDRDGTRFDILGADVQCQIIALADGRSLPAQSVRLGRNVRHPRAMPALVSASARYLQGPPYASALGEGGDLELAFWRQAAQPGTAPPAKLREQAIERLKALGYAQ